MNEHSDPATPKKQLMLARFALEQVCVRTFTVIPVWIVLAASALLALPAAAQSPAGTFAPPAPGGVVMGQSTLELPDDFPTAGPQLPFVDLNELPAEAGGYGGGEWVYQSLPDGLIYKSYLAGAKESRVSAHFFNERNHDFLWDATLGGRLGILRYGTRDRVRPEGFQWDVEGSAQLRLDLLENVDVQGVDFRGGTVGTYGVGPQAIKFGYYHLSSHLGDEFLLKNPAYPRLNYARDVLILGYSNYVNPALRLYAEVGWAFYVEVAKPWEFQLGLDWAPAGPTGPRGAPFVALNTQLRQELDFGGTFTAQAGWAWRGDENSHLLRAGLHYQNGGSNQLSYVHNFEHQIGVGLWYDY